MRKFTIFLAVALASIAPILAAEMQSEWVRPGPEGVLVYKPTPKGDRIMDFSHAGYMGGGVALPEVAVKVRLGPSGGDDTAAIQRAIDQLAAMPMQEGLRGAILLAPGVYSCSTTIEISASGIVLRGHGTNTTIRLTGRPHNGIALRTASARGNRRNSEELARTVIADAYVPSGALRFSVADAKSFAAGDVIEIRRPVTKAWVEFMEMHDLVRDGRPQTWLRAGSETIHERSIASVSGNKFTLDVPLPDSFDLKFLDPPGVSVVKIRPQERLSRVAVESLRIESPPQPISHTQPHFTAIRMNAEDSWLRDLTIEETMNSVGINGRRITVQRVAVNRTARHEGSSKPAEFAPNGTQILLDRCSSTADNVWYVATGAGVSGPIVLLHCDFRGNGRAESHQRWSTGMLYDNCRAPGGGLEFRNRGSMGSGHGWSMGWGVAWNCVAKDYVIQNPPGAVNWMIGCMGENLAKARPFGEAPALEKGIEESPGAHVKPLSLYLAQLAERMGPQALKNIGY